MIVGSQELPWTLVSLLRKDKASQEAAVLSWVQGDCNPSLSLPCPSREQQEPLAIWAV